MDLHPRCRDVAASVDRSARGARVIVRDAAPLAIAALFV
jgi:hypothetical protein